jgi:DNA-binding transcriptional regulator YdaS (Cro superfamily)
MNINEYISAFPRGTRLKEIKRLAKACGISYNTMKHVVYNVRQVSKSLALPLEIATGGKVKCSVSRPDIYPCEYHWQQTVV